MTTFGTPELLQAELAYRRERMLTSTRSRALRRRVRTPRAARIAAVPSAAVRPASIR